ncbi:hypothetical protein QR680_017129 [Steinernema hermaphroditum]|uniref:ARF7 effector protein C-terminal domain-containing protein n=1 Tax=Steinernema hermaphroditum TaxID=289476 RepID=A0AA39LN39_9BILA|nr:hypothetical protein QR680_017129 [Steinernema hermaphroditum]
MSTSSESPAPTMSEVSDDHPVDLLEGDEASPDRPNGEESKKPVRRSQRGRVLRPRAPKKVPRGANKKKKVVEWVHDAEGKIQDPRTGRKINLCDCFDLACQGCNAMCSECGRRFCRFICQRNRDAYLWWEPGNGVKRRHPFMKPGDDDSDYDELSRS